jgi:hypothetical protein
VSKLTDKISTLGPIRQSTPEALTGDDQDAHGRLLAGILATTEQMHTKFDGLRNEIRTDKGLKLRGVRYVAVQNPLLTGGRAQVLAATASEWLGYLLTETTGTAPLSLFIGDGDQYGADPIGPLNFLAGESKIVRFTNGISTTRGFVITPGAGAGSITGSVFLR